MTKWIGTALAVFLTSIAFGQQNERDKATFIPAKNPFYEEIKSALDEVSSASSGNRVLKMEIDTERIPDSVDDFETVWCHEPVSQGRTGTCWCFSTTSFFESEVHRISGNEIRLSELYIVYWEYVEKAREFVKTRGESAFAEGSETNAVARMMRMYGAVPLSEYGGKSESLEYHDHSGMFDEMNTYLHSLKRDNAWNEEQAMVTIKSILNHHLGEPPTAFEFNGKEHSPNTFLKQVLRINPNDYVNFMSLMEAPWYTHAVYDVPDNWWKSDDYYNVPLTDFMKAIDQALEKGYSLSIGGDVSGSGYLPDYDVAMIPDYDIPSSHINDYSRQLRFSNRSTTDDHAIHLVGSTVKDGEQWYLIKDSGSGARNGKHPGFYFYHEDYVKLKTMSFTVHKDAVKNLLRASRE